MRIIPKTTKVKVQFFKNVSVLDIIIGLAFLGLIVLLLVTNLGIARFVLAAIVLIGFIVYMLFIKKYHEATTLTEKVKVSKK